MQAEMLMAIEHKNETAMRTTTLYWAGLSNERTCKQRDEE